MAKAKSQKMASAKKNYSEEILCAGFGGQGIMFLGKLIARAGLAAGMHVTWMPSYGAEVRGGTAYSMTKISNAEIASPIVSAPDALIAMNEPSLFKYEAKLKPGGLLIVNRSLIKKAFKKKDARVLNIELTAIASRLGDLKCANMIALGAFVRRSKILSLKNVTEAMRDFLRGKEEMLLRNKLALDKGYKVK